MSWSWPRWVAAQTSHCPSEDSCGKYSCDRRPGRSMKVNSSSDSSLAGFVALHRLAKHAAAAVAGGMHPVDRAAVGRPVDLATIAGAGPGLLGVCMTWPRSRTGTKSRSRPRSVSPSGPYLMGTLRGRRVAFLARHGAGHRVSPSELNFRANIFGFKTLGVEYILSASAVGSLQRNTSRSTS